MQGDNGDTDIKDWTYAHGGAKRRKERVGFMEKVTWKHITICKIDSQWEYAVCLRKLKQWLCINPEGWDGERDGMEVKKEVIYVYLWLIHVEV